MYEFLTTDGRTFSTAYSPREIAKLWCFDAYDQAGNSHVILSEETNFKTFQRFGDPNNQ